MCEQNKKCRPNRKQEREARRRLFVAANRLKLNTNLKVQVTLRMRMKMNVMRRDGQCCKGIRYAGFICKLL